MQQIQQLQYQQQMALLHMYGCVPSNGLNPNAIISLPPHLQPELHHSQHLQHIPMMSHNSQTTPHQIVGFHVPGGMYSGGVPIALAPADVHAHTYLQSHNGGGSWVAPVPAMIGSCVVNPISTGPLLATSSWVK